MSEGSVREKQLNIHYFGGFSIAVNGRLMPIEQKTTSKFLQILQILLLQPEFRISKGTLGTMLYPGTILASQNNSVNNNIYRLRNFLEGLGLVERIQVFCEGGLCWLAFPAGEPFVDVREFLRLVELGCAASQRAGTGLEFPGRSAGSQSSEQQEGDPKERETELLLHTAWDLVTGEFLPKLSAEDWVILEHAYLKKKYGACAAALIRLYMETGRPKQAREITIRAAALYPYDGWQLSHIDALIALNGYEEAFTLYTEVEKLYLEDSDQEPTEEMLLRLKKISEKLKGGHRKFAQIRQSLVEKREENMEVGAYFCTYPGFVDIYRFCKRMSKRADLSVWILQCRLVNRQKEPLRASAVEKKDSLLRTAVENTMREGDVFTCYQAGVYLILLQGLNQKGCRRVYERICRAYEDLGGVRRQLGYKCAPILEDAL